MRHSTNWSKYVNEDFVTKLLHFADVPWLANSQCVKRLSLCVIDMVCKTHVKKSNILSNPRLEHRLHHQYIYIISRLYNRLLACHVHIIQLLSESNLSAASINQPTSITTLVASQKQATLEAILATINSFPTATGNHRWCGEGRTSVFTGHACGINRVIWPTLPLISPDGGRPTESAEATVFRDNSSTYQVAELLRRDCQMHYI